jgi:Acyl-CoA reductase (LuxC)
MNTPERAHALAAACRDFRHLLGPASPEALLGWLRLELGDESVLDGFRPIGAQYLHAVAPRVILHVVSGNTPHAALQSLIRGLLLGSHNLCKLPGAGLPEAEAFAAALPAALRARVEFSATLPDAWLPSADAIIVFGSDKTIAHFRAVALPRQTFLGYGHRVSLGLVFEDAAFDSAPRAALDASLFDQQGCLSPHCIYVADRPGEYAARLAEEMERVRLAHPRSRLSLLEAAAISEIRETSRFRTAIGQPVRHWESPGSDAWTVIFDIDPTFSASSLNRVIFVRPLPDDLVGALAPVRPFLSAIAIWPNTLRFAKRAAALGAPRVCALGRMQEPPWTWRQDGRQTLAPLVAWRGWEPEAPCHLQNNPKS